MTSNVSLSVIIPVLNEAESIPALSQELDQALSEFDQPWEVIWIDDGSTDKTRDCLAILPTGQRFLAFDRNIGKSAAYVAGIHASTGAWVATLDGDGQNVPKDILILLRHAVAKQADIVVGVRSTRHDPWGKKTSSRLGNLVRRIFLKDHFHDIGCGLRVGRREAFEHLPRFEGMHRFIPIFMERQGYQVIQHSVRHRPRQAGTSKFGTLNRFPSSLFDLLGVWWLLSRRHQWPMIEPSSATKEENTIAKPHTAISQRFPGDLASKPSQKSGFGVGDG